MRNRFETRSTTPTKANDTNNQVDKNKPTNNDIDNHQVCNCFFYINSVISWKDSLSMKIFSQPKVFTPQTKMLMESFRTFATQTYDINNELHERTLFTFWKTSLPNETLQTRKTLQWKRLGFQGADPATDFRGGGVLGLRCLLYFATYHPITYQSMLHRIHNKRDNQESYPFSVGGLNIVMMLFEFLGWGFKKQPCAKQTRENLISFLFIDAFSELNLPTTFNHTTQIDLLSDSLLPPPTKNNAPLGDLLRFDEGEHEPSLDSLLFNFADIETEKMFYELFCFCFYELHKEWYSRPNVKYMDFPIVLQATSARCETSIANSSCKLLLAVASSM